MSPTNEKSDSMDGELVSFVIPVYNEENVLDLLFEKISEEMVALAMPYEILFVNDGSDEPCSRKLDDLSDLHREVKVIHLSRNFGQQAAVHAGLERVSGAAAIVMDADLQDDPSGIPSLIKEWENGCDVVYAIRVNRKENILKKTLFHLFYRSCQLLLPFKLPLDAGNFGLIDKKVIRVVTEMPDCHRYYPGLRSWIGFKQTGVRIERLSRYDDRPRVGFVQLFLLGKHAIFSFSQVPLMLFYLLAALAFTAMLGILAFVLYHKLFTGKAIPGWTSILTTICFFGSINAMGIAIVGEYVWRIYVQVLKRPVYITSKEKGFESKEDV
ncbi:MAG: glycosyltransferase family 2 protein [Kiritimatiellaeota bacterium]|nr:glycosyltransferase family 2 protein [Kiritimatiellota bacterium]